jgi:hypothetical protein
MADSNPIFYLAVDGMQEQDWPTLVATPDKSFRDVYEDLKQQYGDSYYFPHAFGAVFVERSNCHIS